MNYDFSSLRKKYSKSELAEFSRGRLGQTGKGDWSMYVGLASVFMLCSLGISSALDKLFWQREAGEPSASPISLMLGILISATAFWAVYRVLKHDMNTMVQTHMRALDFALANNLRYYSVLAPPQLNNSSKRGPRSTELIKSLPANGGSVILKLASDDFRVYSLQKVVSYGKNRDISYGHVFEFTIKSDNIPHVLFDEGSSFLFIRRAAFYEDAMSFRPEGAFGERFSVLTLNGAHIDVLSFLTPELMELIMRLPNGTEIEIIGDTVQVATRQRSRELKMKHIEPIVTLMAPVIAEINDNTRHHGRIAEQPKLPRDQQGAAANLTNQPNTRELTRKNPFKSLSRFIARLLSGSRMD